MTEQSPQLRIRFTKRSDGAVVLQCLRSDGSATWERHERHALFFSFHDLSHFAVETVFAFNRGFYGLIADGWDIADTTGKGKRGKLPSEGILVEHVVGLLDRERVGGALPLSAAEFNAQIAQFVANDSLDASRAISEVELAVVRQRIETLHRQWAAVLPGSSFELTYDRGERNANAKAKG
jgi:hypothetical protein